MSEKDGNRVVTLRQSKPDDLTLESTVEVCAPAAEPRDVPQKSGLTIGPLIHLKDFPGEHGPGPAALLLRLSGCQTFWSC